eukprot:66635-Lingulodinium_polyedra.AAC.1
MRATHEGATGMQQLWSARHKNSGFVTGGTPVRGREEGVARGERRERSWHPPRHVPSFMQG